LSLVDPDNRRPVDFAHRSKLLDAGLDAWRRDPAGTVRRLADAPETGAIKQLVIAVLLAHRREHAPLYELGEYRPLPSLPPLGAFERALGGQRLCVVFRRHPLAHPLAGALPLPDGPWTNLLTKSQLETGEDFDRAAGGLPFVVAITVAEFAE
jgi:(1->4)-alpha-D-glucan 1-alpha-D-glucosylmutase